MNIDKLQCNICLVLVKATCLHDEFEIQTLYQYEGGT